jgi:hypothetical protein
MKSHIPPRVAKNNNNKIVLEPYKYTFETEESEEDSIIDGIKNLENYSNFGQSKNSNYNKNKLYVFPGTPNTQATNSSYTYSFVLNNLIQKLNKIYKSRWVYFVNKIKLYNHDRKYISSPEYLNFGNKNPDTSRFYIKTNPLSESSGRIETVTELNLENEEISDNFLQIKPLPKKNSFNKVIDPDEQIRNLKIEILRAKLLTLINILKKHVTDNFFKFFERMKLKIEMQFFFNKDDNYLYILPKPKLFRFRAIYAYRRLLYVIKKYRYRVNTLLRNVFIKWNDLVYDYLPDINLDSFECRLEKFIKLLQNIFEKKYYIQNMYKLSFLFMKYRIRREIRWTKGREIFENKRNLNLMKIVNFLRGVFYRRKFDIFNYLKEIFEKHDNSNNLDLISRKNDLVYKKEFLQNILSAFLKIKNLNLKNKPLCKNFFKWKRILYFDEFALNANDKKYNEEKTKIKKLKYQSYSKGVKLLINLYKNKFSSKLPFYMRKFWERIIFQIKFRNTVKEYGYKYKKFFKLLHDNTYKEKIYLMRQPFERIFALQKIFLLINLKQNLLYNPTQYFSKKNNSHQFTYTTNENSFIAMIFCFYRWKNLVLKNFKERICKDIMIMRMMALIDNKMNNYFKNFVIYNLKTIYFENKKNTENEKNFLERYTKFFNYLASKFKSYKKNFKSICFNKIKREFLLLKAINKKYAVKLILAYKKYNYSKIEEKRKLKNYFSQWKILCNPVKRNTIKNTEILIPLPPGDFINHKILNSKLLKQILKIQFLISRKYSRDLKFFFTIFKIKSKAPEKKIFVKSQHVKRIDFLIIENQSKILAALEHEENKLNKELINFKTFSNNRAGRLLKILYLKNSKLIYNQFKIWKKNSELTSHGGFSRHNSVISHSQQSEIKLKNSNDNLISNNNGVNLSSSLTFLINENENLQNENENLMNVYRSKTREYRKTINDYQYVKGHFCVDCVGEDFEIDYKSVQNMELEDEELEEEYQQTQHENQDNQEGIKFIRDEKLQENISDEEQKFQNNSNEPKTLQVNQSNAQFEITQSINQSGTLMSSMSDESKIF